MNMAKTTLMDGFLSNLICVQCSQRRDISELTLCSDCGHLRVPRRYFCVNHCREEDCGHAYNCEINDHLTCWTGHLSGFSTRLREEHQKLSALHDACIQVIMPPQVDDEIQRRLHKADREAEWFRVTLASPTVIGAEPLLQISDRFKKICDPGRGNFWSLQQSPSFVSFVGDTGVGKSTLVRAMITVGVVDNMAKNAQVTDWEHVFNCQSYGPVTRTTRPDLAMLPTSIGVHLYRDQTLVPVQQEGTGRVEGVPILFADCEGFSAGTMKTDAERNSNAMHDQSLLDPYTQIPIGHGMEPRYVEREIVIKAPDFKDKGKRSADLFYARFLYAFSDVVVFVVNEDQKMKSEMQRLLEWAISAVKKTFSRNSPKTLIVVRNAPNSHNEQYYDEMDLRHEMFDHFGNIWDDSSVLTDYKAMHDDQCRRFEDRIHDNYKYFGLFFGETKICYIPSKHNAPPSRIYDQYLKLRKLISEGTTKGQRVRSNSWTRYTVPSMAHLLNRAFDHFANLNDPFDFHAAARKDNPTPVSIPGHIANLLRHLGTSKSQLDKFEMIVAICLVTYVFRTFDFPREPQELFTEFLEAKCSKGIQIYRKQFQRCIHIMGDGTRCINYGETHASQHCSEKNQMESGNIDSSDFEKNEFHIIDSIQVAFINMYAELYSKPGGPSGNKPSLAQMKAYRHRILSRERPSDPIPVSRAPTIKCEDFINPNSVWMTAKSNMSCFACLQATPDHVLPCGHGFCEECIKDFGDPLLARKYHYEIGECVLCGENAEQWTRRCPSLVRYTNTHSAPLPVIPQIFRLTPRCAGIRLLTLDGGGIRGIIELAMLEKIEKRVGLELPIRELFDLIVGTSTGGIISLVLAAGPPDMPIGKMRSEFIDLAKTTFEKDRFGKLWYFDPLKLFDKSAVATVAMVLRLVRSRYRSSNLKQSLLRVFNEDQPIFGGAAVTCKQRSVRVAVTATSDGEPCIFTNYSRASLAKDKITAGDHKVLQEEFADSDHLVENKGFERQDDPSREAKVWEAAMATSAAPGFFHEWRIDDPENRKRYQVPFVDGALHSNLPVKTALEEKERIWPKQQSYTKPLDLLLSVGTGSQPPEEFKIPNWMNVANVGEAAMVYMKQIVNTDNVWDSFIKTTNTVDPGHYFRLTIGLKEKVPLDNWEQMESLCRLVDSTYEESRKSPVPGSLFYTIDKIAYHLVASMLFYEPEGILRLPAAGRRVEVISGNIWCRLGSSDTAMRKLLNRIEGFYLQEHSRQPTPLQLNHDWKNVLLKRIIRSEPFSVPCKIGSTEDSSIMQTLAVKLHPPAESGMPVFVPISGFPTTFNQLRAGLKQRGIQ